MWHFMVAYWFDWRQILSFGKAFLLLLKWALAILNSFLLAVLDFLGVNNVPKQMRIFDAQPLLAVRLLLGSLLTFK
jgi:hypothetical protein